nr:MAG TPA: hypothetical protein [Herelleviridae sp.]
MFHPFFVYVVILPQIFEFVKGVFKKFLRFFYLAGTGGRYCPDIRP